MPYDHAVGLGGGNMNIELITGKDVAFLDGQQFPIGYGSFARRENRRIFIKLALLRPSGLVGIQGCSGRKRSYVPFLALLAA